MSDVLIIGNGVVGHNLRRELSALNPDVFDKYHPKENTAQDKRYQLAFVCVPTPYVDSENPCDVAEVKAAIAENRADVYVIKSAILPGTTDALRVGTGKRIICSPEYCGSTVHANNYKFDFTILGGEKADCLAVIQMLQRCYDGRHRFQMTDAKTAELVKYMENAFLATKVSFCCQFWEIANRIGVNYQELRELFLLDPRVNPSHTFVFDKTPYWDSVCLNKDIPAIAETYNAVFLKSLIAYNERNRTVYSNDLNQQPDIRKEVTIPMATITKAGDTTRLTADRDFHCNFCGCEFTATSAEYQLPDYTEIGLYNADSFCECPTCHNMVWRFRERRN